MEYQCTLQSTAPAPRCPLFSLCKPSPDWSIGRRHTRSTGPGSLGRALGRARAHESCCFGKAVYFPSSLAACNRKPLDQSPTDGCPVLSNLPGISSLRGHRRTTAAQRVGITAGLGNTQASRNVEYRHLSIPLCVLYFQLLMTTVNWWLLSTMHINCFVSVCPFNRIPFE